MSDSKVSVIVPIYNVEKYVEKCIRSLLDQIYDNIEIWAISDGSLDNSMKIVKKIANGDNRVKIIEKENGGYGSVIEYALKNITTEYFLICDPDDWLEKNAIKELIENAEKTKADLVIAQKYLVYNNKPEKIIDESINKYYPIQPNKISDILPNHFFISVTPHAKLYKTNVAKKIKFLHKVNYTDTTLYLIYLQNIKKILYINRPLANYYIDRPGNSSTELEELSDKSFNDMCKIIKDLIDQSNKNYQYYDCLCYKIYLLIWFLNRRMKLNDNNINEINYLLSLIEKNKKKMKKYIIGDNHLKTYEKKIFFNLLMNAKLRKLAIKLVKKIH